MIGSAMRKPRIQPGPGSASADSMIDGRTMVMGRRRRTGSTRARSPEGLGVGVGVGPAEGLGPGPPASTSCVLTQSSRSCSARSASRWSPAAPSSPRASLVNAARRSGRRDSASRSPRRRRAAVDLGAPVDVHGERGCRPSSSSRGLALVGAGHVRRRHRDEVARAGATLGRRPRSRRPPRPRPPGTGPSRLTSTAVSRGASKLTVAAECTTMSHADRQRRPSSSRPRPSVATSPATARDPGGDLGVEAVAVLARAAGRSSRCSGSPGLARCRRVGAPARADQQHHLASGHGPQEPLDQGRAQESGGAGDEEPPGRARASRTRVTEICLPYGK